MSRNLWPMSTAIMVIRIHGNLVMLVTRDSNKSNGGNNGLQRKSDIKQAA